MQPVSPMPSSLTTAVDRPDLTFAPHADVPSGSFASSAPTGPSTRAREATGANLYDSIVYFVRPALPYVVAGWVGGILLLGSRLLLGVLGLWRWRRAAVPLPLHLQERTTDLARRLGFKNAPRVAAAPRLRQPVAFGLLRPIVLVPVSLLTAGLAHTWRLSVASQTTSRYRRRNDKPMLTPPADPVMSAQRSPNKL